ncbi:MAG: DNA lyase [Desulfobacterales bacterium]|nr:DNA lyase [Desulfobacterales bacterium]
MRLWSIHPGYLDVKGLVALWREGLLAQNVLQGNTKGYKNHPQLTRFKNTDNPVGAIASYLKCIVEEADNRGYKFDRSKIINEKFNRKLSVTSGQLEYEFTHLIGKLKIRDPALYSQLTKVKRIEPHPAFSKINGDVENWEVI